MRRQDAFEYSGPRLQGMEIWLKPTSYSVQLLTLPSLQDGAQSFLLPTSLFEDRFFRSDLENYSAARRAVFDAQRLISWRHKFLTDEIPALLDYPDELRNWRGLFSPTGKTYPNLNKTLDAVNCDLTAFLLPYLAFFKLQRAITNQIELSFLLVAAHTQANMLPLFQFSNRMGLRLDIWDEADRIKSLPYLNLFQRVTESEIREALRIYLLNAGAGENKPVFGNAVDEKALNMLTEFLGYLADYKGTSANGLISLTKRAIHWHDQLARRDHAEIRFRAMVEYGDLTKLVPIPRFDHRCPNLRFLSTLEEICDEAEHMQHCVDLYIEDVLNGKSHIFHLDWEGSEATIEFDFAGILIQANGPKNRHNAAVEFAKANFQNPYKF